MCREGLIAGAENLSDAFVQLASSKLPRTYPDRDHTLAVMRVDFNERLKRTFGEAELDHQDFWIQHWPGGQEMVNPFLTHSPYIHQPPPWTGI